MSDFPSVPNSTAGGTAPSESTVQITHVTYALFALGLLTGGLIAVAGLIVAYIKRDDAAGTYLASHYGWLIRTFWWSLLWGALICVFVVLTIGITQDIDSANPFTGIVAEAYEALFAALVARRPG